MRNLLTLLFLFFIINTSFADNYTYLKGPQISFSNQIVTSSGGTTTFNSLTPMITTVTGTQTQIIKLPSVSSIPVGYSYQIINESTQALTVKDSLDVVIASIEPDTDKKFILFTGGSWSVSSGGGGQGGSEYVYAGAVTAPSITDNGGGSVTVGAIDVVLFDNATQVGTAKKYSLPALTVTLVDNATNYIIADYASGSPALANTTNVNLINESSVVPIYTIYRSGSFLHIQSWDSLGNGLANKLHQSIVKTQRYRRESGLALGETGTRNVTLGSGIVWTGANSLSLDAISTGTDNLFYFLRTGASTWTTQVVTQYNNTDYWNGTTTASLTNNRYAVNWVYRGVESQKHLYVVLGEGDYTLPQAQASQPPANLPAQITSHALLVGRIIVLKSASTATQIDSSFNVVFSGAGASDHNSLTGLQGGTVGEYYHLTAAEDTAVASLSGTTTNYVLKRSATGFANSQIYENGTNIGIGNTTATRPLDVTGNSSISGYLRVGSSSNPTNTTAGDLTTNRLVVGNTSLPSFGASALANITGNVSTTSATVDSIATITAQVVPASSSAVQLRALTMSNTFNTTNTMTSSSSNSPTAGWFENRITNLGGASELHGISVFGMWAPSGAASLGDVTEIDGVYIQGMTSFGNTATSTISKTVGVRVVNSSKNTLNFVNQVGAQIEALSGATNNTHLLLGTSTSPSGNFGIYNASASNNYFNGNIGIGTATPTEKLDVINGNIVTSNNYAYKSRLSNGTIVNLMRYDTGNRAWIGPNDEVRIDGSVLINPPGQTTIQSQIADSATAVNVIFNSPIPYTATGAKLVSFRNNGVEKVNINKDGGMFINGDTGIGTTTPATKLHVSGDSTVTGYQYFGLPTTDGSFRMYVSGGALKIEKRISGTWTSVGQFDEL